MGYHLNEAQPNHMRLSGGKEVIVKRHNATALWQLEQNKKLLDDQVHFPLDASDKDVPKKSWWFCVLVPTQRRFVAHIWEAITGSRFLGTDKAADWSTNCKI